MLSKLVLFCFLYLVCSTLGQQEICQVYVKEYCSITLENLIEVLPNLDTVFSCQQECQGLAGCGNFTWVPSQNNDGRSECIMLESCEETVPCDFCTSGPSTPTMPEFCNCDVFESARCGLDINNILYIHEDVAIDAECQNLCKLTSRSSNIAVSTTARPHYNQISSTTSLPTTTASGACTTFSWDGNTGICYLFSKCPIRHDCNFCTTGPPTPSISFCRDPGTTINPDHSTPAPGQSDVVVLTLGGSTFYDNTAYPTGSTDIFNGMRTCNIHIADLDVRTDMSVETVDGQAIACGGYDVNPSNAVSKLCFKLNIDEFTWEKLETPMIGPYGDGRYGTTKMASLVFKGRMMTIGGISGHSSYHGKYVQEYYHINDTWVLRRDMALSGQAAAAAVQGHCVVQIDDSIIYLIGGGNAISYFGGWKFNTSKETPTWQSIPGMYNGRHGHTCLATIYEGRRGIFVIGGMCSGNNCDVQGYQDVMYFFDCERELWTDLVPRLTKPRAFHGQALIDGVITIYGGKRGIHHEEILDTAEQLIDGAWKEVTDVMYVPRFGFGYTSMSSDIIKC